MRSGQLAHLSAVSTDTLRHYERLGLLPLPQRTAGNYREYSPASRQRVELIQRALTISNETPSRRPKSPCLVHCAKWGVLHGVGGKFERTDGIAAVREAHTAGLMASMRRCERASKRTSNRPVGDSVPLNPDFWPPKRASWTPVWTHAKVSEFENVSFYDDFFRKRLPPKNQSPL